MKSIPDGDMKWEAAWKAADQERTATYKRIDHLHEGIRDAMTFVRGGANEGCGHCVRAFARLNLCLRGEINEGIGGNDV